MSNAVHISSETADLRLENHATSTANLLAVMARAQTRLRASAFIECVSLAFQEVQKSSAGPNTGASGRDSSVDEFKQAVARAHQDFSTGFSILVLGCGEGYAGQRADFAEAIVSKMVGLDAGQITSLNLSPTMLQNHERCLRVLRDRSKVSRFDLIVSHSLLHFIPDLGQYFRLIRCLLNASGGLVAGHEPNMGFWNNSECQEAVKELRRRQYRRRLGALLQRLRPSAAEHRQTIWDRVNLVLRQRHGFRQALTESEIRRIVDVHRPEATPGEFSIGCNGFDVEKLSETYLPDFTIAWLRTAGHLGYHPVHCLSKRSLARLAELESRHPRDGVVFTAYWKRSAAR